MEPKKIFDLSVEIKTNMPCWPTNPLVRVDPIGLLARDGYTVEKYESVTHTGTHIDAPYHMIDNGTTVDRIPLTQLAGPGYCIRPQYDGDEIHADALKKIWKREYDGKIILVNTGWDKKGVTQRNSSMNFRDFHTMLLTFFWNINQRFLV